jgi:(1->4)-alpha-D-glucan 1-alpha-D-glucosylmutase
MYEGDELAFRALVDPDNRRPVDWARRRDSLAGLRGGAAQDAENRKQWLIWKLLSLRARRPEAFASSYQPLEGGPDTVAFVRGGEVLVVVALPSGDPGASLIGAPRGRWTDVLRGGERSFDRRTELSAIVDAYGLAVFERADR